MPAQPIDSLAGKMLGIFAGEGQLPHMLARNCEDNNVTPFIIAFKGHTDPELTRNRDHIWTRPGRAGHIIEKLKTNHVRDLVLIGALKRPGLRDLNPDRRAFNIIFRHGLKWLGDDGLLKAVRKELEAEGFHLHAIQDFLDNLVMPEGTLGRNKPNNNQIKDLERGFQVAKSLGYADVGQSLVIQEGRILGLEAVEGTDALIRRCTDLAFRGPGPILIKARKPGQDRALDMPTVGPDTVRNAGEAGYAGIAIEAENVLVLNPDECMELADRAGMFFYAFAPPRDL